MKATDADRESMCIRLYNSKGEHKASLLACGIDEQGNVDCFDLAEPNGHVLACNISCEEVDMFAQVFEFEPIRR